MTDQKEPKKIKHQKSGNRSSMLYAARHGYSSRSNPRRRNKKWVGKGNG